jgi:transcriptional regulator with XRE-family HTH domain
VLTTSRLLTHLRERSIRDVDIARVLGVPESRTGNPSLKLEEAARLIEHFRLEDDVSAIAPMSLSAKVAANIQQLREAQHLSRPQLAQRCRPSTTPQQIERLEKGKRRLSLDWVERLAHGLDVDPALLISGSPAEPGGTSREVVSELARAVALSARTGSNQLS